MISYIKGHLTSKNPAQVIIESNGIGYALFISLTTYSKIVDQKEVQLFVESIYVRDDNPKYYGFAEEDERDLFRKIISVSGVGGSSAILMLSSLSTPDIVGAINTANVAMLKSIKGIGEKTAQRIVVDLKGKLGKHEGGISSILAPSYNKNKEEALMALTTLGFQKLAAEKALEKAIKQQGVGTDNVELLIKTALKNI
ncbi:MAG: Holliday junction branch migration protein RuvA [Bacteroidia bacterium]|jgi:holliday junction DNA helicase RuvA|nr:Holliday junction branch migration protein RuvA [Sphingobacteriaceae bacterium]MBK7310429.1 Holliday junction branch migration protein RuvA [Sphingobacteriaceae bacterium]MBK7816453.1 Holliday junction branch migration protein RuvA [Sphingobacteriaceae bacterium]MBP9068226.1 Holliday junction branch migration protein RuvA [Bacteroidia bacterium]